MTETIEEIKKRGSGIAIFFVVDGSVDEVRVTYSDEHPEDLAIVKDALRRVAELGKFELIFKQDTREKREKK